MKNIGVCLVFCAMFAGAASAQSNGAAPKPAVAAAPAGSVEQPKPSSAQEPIWSYDPEERRDPFLSLLHRGTDPRDAGSRPTGVAGLLIADATVRGIVRDKGGFIAMIQAPDSKTYIVRPGDRLFDGTVKSIVADKVVFSQDVTDPLSLVKQREIPKSVRPTEGRGAI
jgi:Tfp pilus assembly protein PilP